MTTNTTDHKRSVPSKSRNSKKRVQ
jgi:hypothetical protein